MTEKPVDEGPKGPIRALYRWLKGTSPGTEQGQPSPLQPPEEKLPARLGHYAIERKLGQGGMGVVYAAHDERLERTVALKTMSLARDDETARKRFWREARAAASVNHPNICQIYEIGEDGGQLFIAMELLEGAPLTEHLQKGPVNVTETISIGLGMLAALSALHARGIVHRDLKPSNVFLTPHGVKLLDFGLARPAPEPAQVTMQDLTRVGAVMGTPRYMAPEQVVGETISTRTDLFAAGAILFEMLAGRRRLPAARSSKSRTARLRTAAGAHRTAGRDGRGPGDPARAREAARRAADISRRNRGRSPKHPDRRSGRDSRDDACDDPAGRAAVPDPPTRPRTDFLAFSLPDAITTSLSGIGSLVVRSSATAARFAGDAPDFKVLAAEAGVNRVVMGTLLRSGDQIRAVAQLIEAPGGTVLTSHTVQSRLGDLFRLQDDIARRVVEVLSLPLSGGTPVSSPDSPHNARAYQQYLRANGFARSFEGLVRARDLYLACLDLDPTFAPAWARVGRCHRVIGKYIDGAPDSNTRGEEAFRRALELNPRLTIATSSTRTWKRRPVRRRARSCASCGSDASRQRSGALRRSRARLPVLRVYEESLAAHDEAQRLDPNSVTSFEQTLLMMGEIDRILATPPEKRVGGGDDGIRVIGLGMAGRLDEARNAVLTLKHLPNVPAFATWSSYLRAWLDRRTEEMGGGIEVLGSLKIMEDPEAVFQQGWMLCDVGQYQRGLVYLDRAISRGYFVAPTLAHATQFDPLRNDPAFQSLLTDAEAGRHRALVAFREAGGDRLFGR